MKDFCKYVNVFQGTGEIDLPKPEGVAARWFFIKAGCGNTSPAACLPFSAMSVSPFSGGYPTGYGDHMPNSFARPVHFPAGKGLLGFAHLQQSGTGAIGFYYNYAVVTPFYDGSGERRVPGPEQAQPGYYATTLEDIFCELTVSGRTALHRYSFGHKGGRVRVDFTNNGVNIPNWGKADVKDLSLAKYDDHTVTAEATIEGIRVFFAVRANAPFTIDGGCAVFDAPENGKALLSVSISPLNAETALGRVLREYDFDEARKQAYGIWNRELGKIDIETDDDRVREIFYSNLYHSFVKPADWSDESFVYGKGPFIIDLATLWDIYKTQLPLIYMTNRELGEKLNETLLRLCETLGFMPNGLGLSDGYRMFSDQARMLGSYALFTAYRYGYPLDPKRLLDNFKRDFSDEGKKDFTEQDRCVSHTFYLDMTEICTLAAGIAKETGDAETEALLRPYGEKWRKAYSEETGLLGDDSSYYEGTKYNYSFRQMVDMPARIALAGGNERFVKLLDDFFGYGKPETVQPTDPRDGEIVNEGMKLGRFEGFNNESDTEAPFSYIYAGRQDRTCEVVRAGMKYMFTTGRGGIPGNNDSGALSSYYVMMAFGLFPVAGQDLFLIGSPFIKSAKIALFNGRTLEIFVDRVSDKDIYVKSITFNGKPLPEYKISAGELMSGGKLEFCMCDNF
ncbi:MAG: glycoside hydrolase family 92 protein [Clostridia bacterium]|nr:glycoside hydrolase family 92 protein [Clostridia bacterium]